jgi:hypothetical protein
VCREYIFAPNKAEAVMRKLGLVLLLSITGAVAANAAGDNVVLIAVQKVDVPRRLPGICDVKGVVSQVEDGRSGDFAESAMPGQ